MSRKLIVSAIIFACCLSSPLAAAGEYDAIGWQLAESSAAWTARKGHQVLVFNDELFLVAGNDSTTKNDVWKSTNGWSWKKIEQDPENPFLPIRSDFQALEFDNRILILGGLPELNDIWSSTDGFKWTQETSSAAWSERNSFQAVVFNDKIWIMGGREGTTRFNDIWSSTDGVKWSSATIKGDLWSMRSGHQTLVFNDKIWVLGGYDGTNNLNDLWYSSDGKKWEEITPSPAWPGREGHQALVYDDKMWIIGGRDNDGNYLSDIWYTKNGVAWSMASNGIFPGRTYHQAVVFRDEIWVLGGEIDGPEYINDIWITIYPPRALGFSGTGITTESIEWTWKMPLSWSEDEPNSPEDSGYFFRITGPGKDLVIPMSWENYIWLTEGLDPLTEYKVDLQLYYSTGSVRHYLKPVPAFASTLSTPLTEPDFFIDPRVKPVPGATRAVIKWQAVAGVTHYRIVRDGNLIEEQYKHSNPPEIVSYTDAGLKPSTNYTYKIFPLNKDMNYDESSPLKITIMTTSENHYKPSHKFITPSQRSVSFGENAKEVIITDIRGRTVARLKQRDPFIEWTPDDEVRGSLESGIYIYQVTTRDGETKNGTIVIAR